MIVCICRGASDVKVTRLIEEGAESLRDLQRCGIGDQCGSCHEALRAMLKCASVTRATAACACGDAAAVAPALA